MTELVENLMGSTVEEVYTGFSVSLRNWRWRNTKCEASCIGLSRAQWMESKALQCEARHLTTGHGKGKEIENT